jgi:hypothetical protein
MAYFGTLVAESPKIVELEAKLRLFQQHARGNIHDDPLARAARSRPRPVGLTRVNVLREVNPKGGRILELPERVDDFETSGFRIWLIPGSRVMKRCLAVAPRAAASK